MALWAIILGQLSSAIYYGQHSQSQAACQQHQGAQGDNRLQCFIELH